MTRILSQIFVIAAAFAVTIPAFAANYPLELVSPRAVGTAPISGAPAITAGNRIFKAYPGLEYNIRAVVVGGTYPYNFALSNAPAGMTINSTTGEIRWPNATGTTVTPTISVTDAEGTQRSSPWTITVSTAGFKFVDAVNGRNHPTGTGTAANPWRNLIDIREAPNAVAGDVVYFRTGTYTADGMSRGSVGSAWERIDFRSDDPNAWIAYPGETPIIDFGFVPGGDPGVLLRVEANNLYLDGLTTRNSRVIGFQSGHGAYGVYRRLKMRDHNRSGVNLEGTNASYIMTLTGGETTYGQYLAIQDNDFYNGLYDPAIKIYSQRKLLIEGNTFRDVYYGTELKADMPQFTYRGNRHYNVRGRSIGGNMHTGTTHGEILFNLVNMPTGEFALDVNQDSMAQRIDIYRNTFVGRVRLRNTDSADGPFRFYNNVIVNSDTGTPAGSRIVHENVSDPSRAITTDNLTGAPGANVVDSSGALTGSYSQYVGTRGHQIGIAPLPPTSLSVQ